MARILKYLDCAKVIFIGPFPVNLLNPVIKMGAIVPANQHLLNTLLNTLLLNASFIDNLGLMHGKMGISICFFYLARQTQNKIYEDYAGELIDKIYEEITADATFGFENGLAGIGWGIEYLVLNKFIDADTDEVLEEFDNRVFKELIYNTPKDIGLLNGVLGIGAYFLKRIQNHKSNDENIQTLTNKQTLILLVDELDRKSQDVDEIMKGPNRAPPFDNPKVENLSHISSLKSPSVGLGVKTAEPKETNEYSNSQTIGQPNVFDITWDYAVLLWYLAELYEQNIFNFKVEKIIQRLTGPLSDNNNLPKLQTNRLLLALALTKLQQTINHKQQTKNKKQLNYRTFEPLSNYSQTIELSNIETIIINLHIGITRNTINSELPLNNATLRYGTSGIAWIYRQLYHFTGDSHFKEEMEYWTNLSVITANRNEVFLGAATENSYGILEGLGGTLVTSEMQKQQRP
jgi:hypothetical protein